MEWERHRREFFREEAQLHIRVHPEDYEVENTELPLGGRLVDTAWTAQVDEPYLELGSFQAEVGYHVPHAS